MSPIAKVAMLLVVIVDIMGQGLVFPIVDELVMNPASGFLPRDASATTRSVSYGLVMAVFFISWTIGAPYVSKLSDAIGRKPAILICLFGGLSGYALTIVALYLQSFWLLIVARAISGFTAANQPIAQAAMIDGSRDSTDRGRNMGLLAAGFSIGLIGGPLVSGVLSNPNIVGGMASLAAPFYAAAFLIVVTIVFVWLFFEDTQQVPGKFIFKPLEVIGVFTEIAQHPLVVRLVIILVVFHVSNLSVYIYIVTYMTVEFNFTVFQNSMIFLVIGAAIAISSTFIVVPANARFDVRTILIANFLVWCVAASFFIITTSPVVAFISIFVFYFAFGVTYPTLLATFSHSVNDSQQGWVMGMTVAVFTAIGGAMSLFVGWLGGINPKLPFAFSIVGPLVAIGVVLLLARHGPLRRLIVHNNQRS